MKVSNIPRKMLFLSIIFVFLSQSAFALNEYEKKGFDLLETSSVVSVEQIKSIVTKAKSKNASFNFSALAEGSGWSMLMTAIYYGASFDVVKYLVDGGANLQFQTADGYTALVILASGYTPSKPMTVGDAAQKFIYIADRKGVTKIEKPKLLRTAVQHKQLGIVKYLVESKQANVNTRDEKGCTPLMYAMLFPSQLGGGKTYDLVVYLVETAKADVTAKDNQGNTVISYIKDKFFPMAWDMDDYKKAGDYLKLKVR